MPASEGLRNLTPFNAPAMDETQIRAYNRINYDNEYGGEHVKDSKSLESLMQKFFNAGVSCEAMIQAIQSFQERRKLWYVVVDHEVDCKGIGKPQTAEA